MFTNRGYIRQKARFFSLAYAIALVLFYLTYMLYDVLDMAEAATAVNYVMAFYEDALSFVMPMILAITMECTARAVGVKHALTRAPMLTLPLAAYILISEYISATMSGYDFTDAILLGSMTALVSAVFLCADALVAFLIMHLMLRKHDSLGSDDAPFDTSKKPVQAILTVCLIQFALALGLEIYDAVSYLIDYNGTYLAGEIVYMTVRFVFILGELLVCQLLAVRTKNVLCLTLGQEEKEK